MSPRQDYFLPGWGISKQIIFSQLQYYLGPDSTVRPYSYKGREGYLISSSSTPLTKTQIEDLQNLSRQYEEQCAQRMASTSSASSTVSSASSNGSSTDPEPYINQPVPMIQREHRRRREDERSSRRRR